MIYEDYYAISEMSSWRIETDIAWDKLDKAKALSQPDILTKLRDACIIESHHPMNTGRLMLLLEDDIDATGVLSIELYEGFRHFYVLKKYLEMIEYSNRISDEELVRLRKRALNKQKKPQITRELMNFIGSEHFAAYFFLRISQKAKEEVLRQISTYIAKDEFRHAQAAYDVIKRRLDRRLVSTQEILEVSYDFRHYGNDIVKEVPIFERNDLAAIYAFMKKIELLTGKRLVDYVKQKKI